jgi:hypothetical protein
LNSTVPVNGAIDVPVGQTLSATFNETMNTLSVVNAFTLTGPGGPVLLRVVSYDPISSIATFDPTGNLAPGVYTAKIANTATDLAGNALVQPPVGGLPVPNPWSFTIPVPVVPVVPLAIDLGRAAGFGIAASRGLSSTGKTVVNGDVALSPLPTCSDASGLPANCDVRFKTSPIGLTVNGSIYFFGDPFDNGVTAAAVKTDLKTAWDQGRAKTCDKGAVGADQLGGKTLAPGVYCNANLNLATNTVLSLDAAGDTAAVWIFQVTTTLTSAAAGGPGTTRIDLLNGAQARNVWFVIGVDATIADDIIWKGNVLVGDTLTLNSRAQMLGRALAGADEAQAGGAVSILDGVTITVPQ